MNLLYVIHSYTHSCHNHSCQTHSCHTMVALVKLIKNSIHTHFILPHFILTYLILILIILTITYSHCFFNLKITFIYSTLTPYIYTFLTIRIQEMQTTHTYIIFVILFIISFVKNLFVQFKFYLI